MQGFERMDRELLDAAALAGHLVPAGSMFAFLAAHRAEVFPDADYADLFSPPGLGRPSLLATQMAAVMTLQVLHDYSDRETAEAVRFDVRWKVAIGASLDYPGFDPSSLVYWRKRLAKSERPHRVSEAVRKIVEQTGILKGGGAGRWTPRSWLTRWPPRTRSPSWSSAIRRMAREVPGAAAQIAAVCTGHDYSKPGKPKIDWDDPAAKDALVSVLVSDANALVAAFAGVELESRPPQRWRCWRWSPGRTSSLPRALTGGTGGGGSPARSPRTVDLHRRPRGPAYPQVPRGPPGRLPRPRGRRPGHRDHHR